MNFDIPDPDREVVAGRYRIISELKSGGMGQAHRAWDMLEGRPVVVKRPKPELAGRPDILARFSREARAMQSLDHRHVIPVLDIGEDKGIPFIVMPYLPGGSLADRRLRDESDAPLPMTPDMLHLWLPAIAEALDYVNSHGIIHRDVKPANIFFDAFWSAVLGDLGIVKFLDDTVTDTSEEAPLTSTQMTLGTWDYMAPERISARNPLTGASDQYSLGVVVYEMCCGQRPFTGRNAHIAVELATMEPPPLRGRQPHLPATLCNAVHRSLAKAPAARFRSCAEFAAAALAEVPEPSEDPGVMRMLCPGCGTILKLSDRYAGQAGRCPKCTAAWVVAAECDALWLRDEDPRQGETAPVTQMPEFQTTKPSRQAGQRRKPTRRQFSANHVLFGVMGLLTALAIALAVFLNADPERQAADEAKALAGRRGGKTAAKERALATLGRYDCLVLQRWTTEGLEAYERSGIFGFSNCAREELALRSRPQGQSGFDVAREWWRLRDNSSIKIYDPVKKTERPLNKREKDAVATHVKQVYLRALAATGTKDERERGRRFFDSSKELQKLVDGRRP
ncbi:MAG: protein kinase domain-containing protein [Planctomycetia bacterium]